MTKTAGRLLEVCQTRRIFSFILGKAYRKETSYSFYLLLSITFKTQPQTVSIYKNRDKWSLQDCQIVNFSINSLKSTIKNLCDSYDRNRKKLIGTNIYRHWEVFLERLKSLATNHVNIPEHNREFNTC